MMLSSRVYSYRARSARGAVAMSAAASLVLAACSGSGKDTQNTEGPGDMPAASKSVAEITWAIEAEPATLDPIYDYAYFDNTVVGNMCEPLVRMNPDLTTSDWLATSKMVKPTTWTYDLKPGVTFWDGSPLTPEDVVFSIKRNLDPKLGSYYGSYYTRVEDVLKTGPRQVTVTFTKPDAIWNTATTITTGNFIISKKFAEAAGDKFGSSGAGIMCTGPFKFDEWTQGDSITMSKNTNYWNSEVNPKVDKVKFIFLDEGTAQANALTSGQAQGMYVNDPAIIPQLEKSDGNLYIGNSLSYQHLSPSTKDGPLKNESIRRALSLALDRQAIAEKVYSGAGEPIRTLVDKNAWGSDPKVIAAYKKVYDQLPSTKPDLEEATKLVQETGSPKDKIVLAYTASDSELKLATVVQDTAKKIGLNVKLKPLTPSEAATLYQDPHALARAGIDMISVNFQVNNADPFGMYQMFDPGSKSVYNYSGYYNKAAADDLAKANSTHDDVKRAELTAAAESRIMADLPIIPLVSRNTVLFMNKAITGAPASYAQIWYPWAADLGGS